MAVWVPSQSVPLSPSSSSLSRSSNFRRSNRQELCPIQRLDNCSSDTSSKSLNSGEASCMTARSVIISRGAHIKHHAAFFHGQLFSPKLVSGPILLNIPRMHIKHYTTSYSAPSSSPELVSPPNLFNMSRFEEEHKKNLGSHLRPRMNDASYDSRSLWRYEKEKLELKIIANSVSKNVSSGQIPVKDLERDFESVQNGSTRNNPATDFDRQSESAMRQTDRDCPTESQPLNPVGDIKGHVSDSVGARHNDSTINGCSEHSPDKAPSLEKHDILKGDHKDKLVCIYEKVLVVDDIATAKKVVQMLITKYKNIIHACDTEVANIDVKEETPVDHGEIICLSIYSGPEVDFGNGKNCIWVDVLDGGRDVFMEFAPFFEDPSIKKVWHNYSFDAHVIENYGINLSGFHADTMHLARLWDSSRRIDGGYSLEALTCDPKVMNRKKATQYEHADGSILGKLSMKSIFGKKKMKKDGSDGKKVTIDPVELLQRGEERIPWIGYSVLDSINTLELFDSLKEKLQDRVNGISKKTMYDFYEEYWRQFGFLLVKMESEGMLVDRAYLSEMEKVAIAEQQIAADRFRKWASKYCPDAKYMNVGSDIQIRQLLFGGIRNRKDAKETLPLSKTFKVPNTDKVIEEGKKAPSKFRTITLNHLGFKFHTETYTPSGWPSVSRDALKASLAKISSDQITLMNHENELQSDMAEQTLGHQTNLEDEKGEILGSGSNFSTSNLATSYHSFEGDEGKEACDAIAALCEICSIDSLISNFIIPLQGNHISGKNGRIHCSLNINTETGRLSARRPSLQNQPALEKDRYKIRKAFIAESGKSLIVADYGQLELRILAHLADCKSMLEAFKAGGDFHSRTAINMYDHVRKAVDEKRVLLEWHPQPGEDKPPVPLLKDAFASERRKAKMLNFSIAYGKTAVGLSKDWKVSVEEAKQTLTLWYSRRKEVRKWQLERKKEAHNEQCVYTLLGRARNFPSMTNASSSQRGHIERAAINAPVQGSAADVAMCAMLEIDANTQLKDLGWKLLLQVHDEVILEGPTESAEIAKAIVVDCMSKPFNGKNILKVDLTVDAKCAKSWYDAK